MSFLYFLQELRNPVTDFIFATLTHLGEEAIFLLVALLVFWCIDKKHGYYFLTVSFVGLSINQFLKLLCRIPRPWVLDPDFPIVESAREAATGYSFPSGHTQNAVNTYGSIARFTRSRALRIGCIAAVVVVAFSRLYLGVHTPKDVLTSLVIGTALVLVMYPLIRRALEKPVLMYAVIGVLVLLATAFVLYAECYAFPADVDPVNLAEGRKNAWTILGCAAATLVVYTVDTYFVRFETSAPLPAQICKLVFGGGLTVLLKSVLKSPLLSLCADHPAAHALRYFLMVVFAAAIWPMTFPFWTRLFSRRGKALDKAEEL
jgi:undecaprenyl-diphosphatase